MRINVVVWIYDLLLELAMPCEGRCSPQLEEVQRRWYSFGDQRNCSPIDNDDHSRQHSCRTD